MRAMRVVLGACFALALPMAAQAGPLDGIFNGIWDTDSADDLQPNRHDFMNTLYVGYYDLSDSRNTGFDNDDAELFHQKARGAFRGAEVLPEEISDRDLEPNDEAELTMALIRLRRAFVKGGREVAPREMAFAQVGYDCWIEAAEAGRDEDAARCRQEFLDQIARVEDLADFGIREAAADTVAAPAPMPTAAEYLIYFEFDSTVMTPRGEQALSDSIDAALADPGTGIELVGHADRSGTEAYNLPLSQRRSRIAVDRMTAEGVDPSRISSSWVGETEPLCPTPDGVRDQCNRVVVVTFN